MDQRTPLCNKTGHHNEIKQFICQYKQCEDRIICQICKQHHDPSHEGSIENIDNWFSGIFEKKREDKLNNQMQYNLGMTLGRLSQERLRMKKQIQQLLATLKHGTVDFYLKKLSESRQKYDKTVAQASEYLKKLDDQITELQGEMKRTSNINQFKFLEHLKADFFGSQMSIQQVVSDILKQEQELKRADEKMFLEMNPLLLQTCQKQSQIKQEIKDVDQLMKDLERLFEQNQKSQVEFCQYLNSFSVTTWKLAENIPSLISINEVKTPDNPKMNSGFFSTIIDSLKIINKGDRIQQSGSLEFKFNKDEQELVNKTDHKISSLNLLCESQSVEAQCLHQENFLKANYINFFDDKVQIINEQTGQIFSFGKNNFQLTLETQLDFSTDDHHMIEVSCSLLVSSYNITYLILGSRDDPASIQVWDHTRNKKVIEIPEAHAFAITSIIALERKQSQNYVQKYIGSSSCDSLIKIWCFRTFPPCNHDKHNDCVNAEQCKSVEIEKCSCELKLIKSLKFHTDFINCLLYMNLISCLQLDLIVSGSSDQRILVWDWKSDNAKPLRLIPQAHGDQINCLEHLREEFFASGGSDGKIKIWDVTNVEEFQIIDNQTTVSSINAFQENLLVTSSNIIKYKRFLIHIINWYDGTIVGSIDGSQNRITKIHFLNPETMITCERNKNYKIWRLKGMQQNKIAQ